LIISAKLSADNQILTHQQSIEKLLIVEKSFLEKNWEDISRRKEDKIVLSHIANDVTSLYSTIDNKTVNIARSISSLKEQGVISSNNSIIIMNDPLFKEWIIKNILN
jgi:hypothetical protein